MDENKKPDALIERDDNGNARGLGGQVKLILRLLRDSRVNPLLKLLPIGALVYLVVPDLVIGPFDDAVVLGIGMYTFVELCPADIVAEHRLAISAGK